MKIRNLIASVALGAAVLLAGLGTAHAQFINAQTGTSYTFVNTDCSKIVTFNNGAAVAVTLPQPSSATGGGAGNGRFMPPCTIVVRNLGAGAVTITPVSSTIGLSAVAVLNSLNGMTLTSDGTNWQVPYGISFWTTE